MLTNTNIVQLRPKRSLPYPFELVVPRPPCVCSSPHARCLPSSSRPFRVKRDRLIARHSSLSRIFQHQHLLAIGLLLAFKWSLSQLGNWGLFCLLPNHIASIRALASAFNHAVSVNAYYPSLSCPFECKRERPTCIH